LKQFGLTSLERIKRKKDFELVYSSGSTVFSGNKKLKAVYLFLKQDNPVIPVKFACAVSKKSGKAVWRNRIKRILRVSYRLNKEILNSLCLNKGKGLMVIFSPYVLNERHNRVITLNDIMPEVIDIMNKIKQ
jgi:ribonuclease P protein component, eubacterial